MSTNEAPSPALKTERLLSRRVILRGIGWAAGGALIGGVVGWTLGKQHVREQYEQVRSRVRYVDIGWEERPDLTQTTFDIIRFSGDPADAGKSKEERTRVGLIGITREVAHDQLVVPGRQVGIIYWAPSAAYGGQIVAHRGLLGSVSNLGVTQRLATPGEQTDPSRQTVDVLTVGATLAGGALAITMAGVDRDNNFVPVHGVEDVHVMTTDTLGRHYSDIPVV